MTTIQEATKQVVNHIGETNRTHLSERSLKIAEEHLAKMRNVFKKIKAKTNGAKNNA